MMDVVDFELCLDVDKYHTKLHPKPQPQNPPEADTKAEAETIPLLNNAPPKSSLVRKYAEFVEEEYSTLSRKKENDKGNNDIGFWLSLPPKRPRLLPSELEDSASPAAAQHSSAGYMGSTSDQGRGQGARPETGPETGTDTGVDGDGDTMMDVDTGVLSSLPVTTPTTATAPPFPSPNRTPARPSRLAPSASTQFAIYEDPDTMDVDGANIISTPLHSPMYGTAPADPTTTSNNNNSHYVHPYVSAQADEDKENTENEDDGEEDSNAGETFSSQQSTLTGLTEGDQQGFYHGEHHHHHHQQHHHYQRQRVSEDQESQADDEADDDEEDIYSRTSAATPFASPPSRRMTLTRRRRTHQYYTYHPHGYLGQQPGYEYDYVGNGSDTSTYADISTSIRGFVGGEPSWNNSPGSGSAIAAFGGREGRVRRVPNDGTVDSAGIADGANPVDIRQEMLSSTAVPGDYHRSRGGLRPLYPGGGGERPRRGSGSGLGGA